MTLLIASIAPRTTADLEAVSERAWAAGADAVEIRIDDSPLELSELSAWMKRQPDRRFLVTCRSLKEGGGNAGETSERVEILRRGVDGTGAMVDVELADWKVLLPTDKESLLRVQSDGPARRVLILSRHELSGATPDLKSIRAEMDRYPECAVRKIAYRAEHIGDSFAALDLLCEQGKRTIAIAMGEDGLWTRVLARKFKAFATYCSVDTETATAPGQLTVDEMIRRYRWTTIDRDTKVFGVLGDPVAHSMSPLLFNHWFEKAGINAVYLPLLVRRKGDCVRRFLDGCWRRHWLDIGGFSVTTPHKRTVMNWIADSVDSMSRSIGAVNTVCFSPDGPRGYNTDCHAAVDSLTEALGLARHQLAGLPVDVLGTGGAARAVLFGLQELGANLTIFGRSADRTRRLAEQFHARPAPWDDRLRRSGEVLVNCTSVGLWSQVDQSPMVVEGLHGCRLVFDLIYHPLETKLLRDARAAGIATLSGLDMFIRQAAMQFQLWTSRTPYVGSGIDVVRDALQSPPVPSSSPERRRLTIALVGMRGSGKTTVGRELATLLGGECIDTDDVIVRKTVKTIATIFSEVGENGFRQLEREVIDRLSQSAPAVLAVGGGAVLDPVNIERLRRVATLVWLKASPEVLWQRISNDPRSMENRPALTEHRGEDELRRVLAQREKVYRAVADLQVATEKRSPREVAVIIHAWLSNRADW